MFKIGLKESPLCDICEEQESMQHIVLECILNFNEIDILLNNLIAHNIGQPVNWNHLLGMKDLAVYNLILGFLKQINQTI